MTSGEIKLNDLVEWIGSAGVCVMISGAREERGKRLKLDCYNSTFK